MTRRKFSDEEKLRGVRAAIASPRTPNHLKAGLKKYLRTLESRISNRQHNQPGCRKLLVRRVRTKPQLSDWVRL